MTHIAGWLDHKACPFGYDFEAFSTYFCDAEKGMQEMFCNEATKFMQGDKKTPEEIVNQFDLVLILERFEESLALLHVYGMPPRFLFNIDLNENHKITKDDVPCSSQLEQKLKTKYLVPDQRLYAAAEQALQTKIAHLSNADREKFNVHMSHQKLFKERCRTQACTNLLGIHAIQRCMACIDEHVLAE